MKRVPLLLLLVAIFIAMSPPASATIQTLTDQNSTLQVSDQTQSGAFNWTVDGVNSLFQQWFWYRIGSTPEASIDTLTLVNATQPAPDKLDLLYSGAGFTVLVEYDLTGGSNGSHRSDVAETVRINNTSNSNLDMHFFQYTDFDLNRLNLSDTVHIYPTIGSATVVQAPVSNGTELNVTIVTPPPNHVEANLFANTRTALNDSLPTTLNDVLSAGPGDATWAFQWDAIIPGNNSLIISQDNQLGPVPEPAAIGLFGGVLVLLATRLRKRAA